MDQALETITRRINALGLTEPTIAFTGRGDNEILVQLPGEGDPTRAKAVIQAGGQLELSTASPTIRRIPPKPPRSPPRWRASGRHRSSFQANRIRKPGQASQQVYYILDRAPIVTGTGSARRQSAPSTQNPGQYEVQFHLSTRRGRAFRPVHRSQYRPSHGHRPRPQGLFRARHSRAALTTRAKSPEISARNPRRTWRSCLRAGALPASIKYLEERTVGPSLGADSIREGVRASIGSIIVVMIFLVIYYRLSGVNAVVALFLNLVILIAFMAYAGAVLTLPGIAGVILTIGMGVDSNVLVFERIREELRNGKAPASAVDAGFGHAFLTIIDTHVTTIVSAIFLFLFGTGPVRGFAVTLVIGLTGQHFHVHLRIARDFRLAPFAHGSPGRTKHLAVFVAQPLLAVLLVFVRAQLQRP